MTRRGPENGSSHPAINWSVFAWARMGRWISSSEKANNTSGVMMIGHGIE
jgi:hypothetical protein